LAISTPPTVLTHSIATPPAFKTQLAGMQRYIATQPAAPTLRWAFRRAKISPPAMATLILATLVSLAIPRRSVSANPARRMALLSPASVGQQFQVA
jgi:hypothetical protein